MSFATSWIFSKFPKYNYRITFFFSFMTASILLYPYLEKSIISFFFSSSSPNSELHCFLSTYREFSDPEEGKFIDLILS